MTTKRLGILLGVLAVGMGSIFLLPKQLGYQPTGVRLELPEFQGEWFGRQMEITQKEKEVLVGSEFARKVFTNTSGGEILAQIVLSGQDMNTGIHRPERCNRAQGWDVVDSTQRNLQLEDATMLRVTRLLNVRTIKDRDGNPRELRNVSYYWFKGHLDTTPSHYGRTFMDIRDRLLHGYNQRWAYISVMSNVTEGLVKFGRNEADTDIFLTGFIRELAPKVHQPSEAKTADAR